MKSSYWAAKAGSTTVGEDLVEEGRDGVEERDLIFGHGSEEVGGR